MKDILKVGFSVSRLFRLLVPVALFLEASTGSVFAQISPGPLSSWHKQLEGISNCTSCHTLGRVISNVKCLSCHKEIDVRIKEDVGYHATVSSKQCADCHQEHLGRNYEIVRFDTAAFNHAIVGFQLEGRHKTIGCRSCHNPSHIMAQDVKRLPVAQLGNTYLGLSPTCSSCHEDIHKGQFTQACSSCHNTDRWNPASNFNHDKTVFPLTSKHATVGCYQCHNQKLADGKTVKYIDAAFSSCADCHADPHKGEFKEPCSSCHNTESFLAVSKLDFDHSKTSFPLLGKHAGLKCAACHQDNPNKRNASGEFGFHIAKFQECSDCHADAHAGQFDSLAGGDKCEKCHNVDGFTPATFTVADHQKTSFVLDGSHLAVACVDCHLADKVKAQSTRQFIWKGRIECTTCHADVHEGQFANEMTHGCVTCHTTTSWKKLLFSHDQTKFPLRGKHAVIACSDCHKQPKDPAIPVQYVGLDMRCSSCHQDEHAGQFAVNGFTDCSTCHTADGWKQLIFDHNTQSDFPLTGKHVDVPCAKCHPTVEMNDKPVVKYKPIGTRCIDCHSA